MPAGLQLSLLQEENCKKNPKDGEKNINEDDIHEIWKTQWCGYRCSFNVFLFVGCHGDSFAISRWYLPPVLSINDSMIPSCGMLSHLYPQIITRDVTDSVAAQLRVDCSGWYLLSDLKPGKGQWSPSILLPEGHARLLFWHFLKTASRRNTRQR